MKIPFLNRSDKGSRERAGGKMLYDWLPKSFLLKEDLPPDAQRVCNAMFRIKGRNARGFVCGGMGISLGDTILTALHVIRDAEDFHLVYNGENIGMTEIAQYEKLDLALLKLDKPIPSKDKMVFEEKEFGYDELYILGYIWVSSERNGRSTIYKERLFACKVKDMPSWRMMKDGVFTAEISREAYDFLPGFSGGALVDIYGKVRGILQGSVRDTGFRFGMIPISHRAYIWGVHSSAIRDFLEKNLPRSEI